MTRPYIPVDIERTIRLRARNRCGYCLSPQHLVMARLEIEHIIPLSKGGSSSIDNLWLACPICNRHKADQIEGFDLLTSKWAPLFNPRFQSWWEHFRWGDGGLKIVGLSTIGRATVAALRLSDDVDALMVRSYWIQAGWHPPQE